MIFDGEEIARNLRVEARRLAREATSLRAESERLYLAARTIDGKVVKAARLRAADILKERNLSYRDVAAATGYTKRTVESQVNGYSRTSKRFLTVLAKLLSVSVETLSQPSQNLKG